MIEFDKQRIYKEFNREVFIMKRNLLLILGVSVIFMSTAVAEDNIAVVDLQKIVSSSSAVKQLKQEHSKKMSELDNVCVDILNRIIIS